jgi:hypothetical protein
MKQLLRVLILTVFISLTAAAQAPLNLPEKSQGENAITMIADRLPEIANEHSMSAEQFARILREDPTAWINEEGRMFYVDPLQEYATIEESEPAEPVTLEQAFSLNSRPGSKRVIFLDFDGMTMVNRAWAGGAEVTALPYSYDSDRTTFSATELTYIQLTWATVAEDMRPFDVNVTTEDPGQDAITRSDADDEYYGTRVLITNCSVFGYCGWGGVAWLHSFDDIGDKYKPALVFNTSLRGIREASTHEAGHNLSLSHDGTSSVTYYRGHNGWAPIMGVGYYQPLVQWSQGEYFDANQQQDDIQRIQNIGAPLAADDHGDTNIDASELLVVNKAIRGSGDIGTREDVDVFKIVGGTGSYRIQVYANGNYPNLDIQAQLIDSDGNLVADSNEETTLDADISVDNLPQGEYFLTIDGVGKGDPLVLGYTDYASLGHYEIRGTAPNPIVPLVLRGAGYKLKGVHHAELTWAGGNEEQIDIYRNSILIARVPNNGNYIDNIGLKGKGQDYNYDICVYNTTACSNPLIVSIQGSKPKNGTIVAMERKFEKRLAPPEDKT